MIAEEKKTVPFVSVIIPVFKVEEYIERCARSLFEQTLDNIEYLFIDDCTPDNSIKVLKKVLEDYPHRKEQVVIHRMDCNSGQAAVRKWGIQNAKGDFVIHCDSDDWVDKNMYKSMYEKALKEKADVVVCDYKEVYSNGTTRYFKSCHSTIRDSFLINMLCQKDAWSLWNKLFRRSVFYDIVFPKFNMAEDMALCIQLIIRSNTIAYIPQPLYHYYKHDSSITKLATIDNIVANYNAQKSNAEIVFNEICQSDNLRIRRGALAVKLSVISVLFPIVHIKEYRHLCFNTYPGIFWKVLFYHHIETKNKIMFVLAKLRLFPYRLDINKIL